VASPALTRTSVARRPRKAATSAPSTPFWFPGSARAASTLLLTVVIVAALMIPVGATAQVVLASQFDDRAPTQAIVMLDPGRVWGDPDATRTARIDHAAELYRDRVAPVVIVTGPPRTHEATIRALQMRGVSVADVVTFDSGADTVGPLTTVASVMRDLRWTSATIVTDPAHAARVQSTAGVLGIDAHISPTEYGSNVSLTSDYVGREVAALLRHHLFTRWSLPTLIQG